MTKAPDEMTPAVPNQLSRWVGGGAYAACGWAFVFTALSCYWALGGTAGSESISPAIVQLARAHVPWVLAALWITAMLKVFSGFVALALIQPWGKLVPRPILLILAWGAGTLLFVHGPRDAQRDFGKQAEKQKADLDGDDVIVWHTERVLR